MIPKAVDHEIGTKPGEENDQVQALLKKRTLRLRQVSEKILAELPSDLGRGERETIALAIDAGADLVIIDDQQGRLVSRDKGLSVTGTVGVLIEAKERGFIPFHRASSPPEENLLTARPLCFERSGRLTFLPRRHRGHRDDFLLTAWKTTSR